jgi:hypothetical protein
MIIQWMTFSQKVAVVDKAKLIIRKKGKKSNFLEEKRI